VAVLAALRPSLEPVLAPTASREQPFGRYVALFRCIEAQRFQAPRLVRLQAAIAGEGVAGASRELDRLQTLLGFAEVRASGMFAIFVNLFLLWDVFCAAALLRWRAGAGRSVRRWIEAMAEIEALAALGTFACEHPRYAFPEVTAGPLSFVAEGLGHPLLPAFRRVENDVAIASAGTALLVTGSNMSGKSTLLRAVGINAVLALAGAPVCARRLSLAECQVRTSMRIKDSLEEGVSHFYAELGRLKGIVDAANGGERVLFLLDEVLHGTNSRERNLGAKAVVKHLLDRGAVGAVSSHDLGLSDLEAESGGKVRNVHFQELVEGDKMTFDYKLKPGVVTSSNALRLMKRIGIAVALPDE
jgi:DNA mismatch repair ATPase MutS